MTLIVVAPAGAAVPWSAATDVGPARYMPNGLGFTEAGNGMLALAWRGVDRPSLAAPVLRSGGFGEVSALTRADDVSQFQNVGRGRQVALFGRDRVVATGVRQTLYTGHPWVAFGRIGHRLGRRQSLAIPAWGGGSLAVAANARGDVALIALGCGGCQRSPLYLFYRPHGRGFGRPVLVADDAYDEGEFISGVAPAVAVNAAGDVLVAWGRRPLVSQRRWPLYARIRHAGRWRRPAQRVGDLLESGTVVAMLSDQNRAVVAWWTQHADTGGAGSGPLAPPVYQVAAAGKTGRFGAANHLDAGAVGPGPVPGFPTFLPLTPNLFAAIAPSGRVRLAWTGADPDGPLVRVATLAGGKLMATQTLGRGIVAAVGTDGRDRAVALWGNATRVFASTALAGQPYAAVPELIDSGPAFAAAAGNVAFDPRTHRVFAVWEAGDPSAPGFVDAWHARTAIRRPLTR